ncbi:adenylate kinase family enzyme [Neorhizobium galegae]|uniref:nucleoside kinase n=1 Tax=Neorhizobium galegae TaxID=399 RepID=UPI001AE81D47|nr:nucleoside kinase [Neorhizobium galegae]MBP2549361.1 adenylate kinase family enzyme [Neorhizobium galegae]
MAIRNILIEGGSGTGKTTIATELERRGYHAIHGDRVLAYQGDPQTGERISAAVALRHRHDPDFISRHHIWDVARVEALIADRTIPITFFCGGSRNFFRFIHRFDAVLVLEIDLLTLERRLDSRQDEWGSKPAERALILRQHASRADIPSNATPIDATRPIADVVDDILLRCG